MCVYVDLVQIFFSICLQRLTVQLAQLTNIGGCAWWLLVVADHMFWSAAPFNGATSKWDVSRVTNMDHMFWSAASFNGAISKWDVSRVTNMDD